MEINDLNFNLKFLKSKIMFVENRLLDRLPRYVVNQFFELSKQRLVNFNYKKKKNAISKFNHLKLKHDSHFDPFANIDNSKWLVNISNIELPKHVKDFLSLGGNFAFPIQQSNKKD